MASTSSARTQTIIGLGICLSLLSCTSQPDITVATPSLNATADVVDIAKLNHGDRRLAEMASEIPNLATVTWDNESNNLVLGVRGTPSVSELQALQYAQRWVGTHVRNIKFDQRDGGWTLTELLPFRIASEAVGGETDVISRDLDESTPVLRIGVRVNGDTSKLRIGLRAAAVPDAAVVFAYEEPTYPLAMLQDYNRNQIENGFQITYPHSAQIERACTHGADVIWEGPTPGFITNAHCSAGDLVGVASGTPIYQNQKDSPIWDYLVGFELLDPPTFTGGV